MLPAFVIEDLTPYVPNGFVCFWKPNQPNGYLGNWYDSPFILDGIHFPTSEHYMMYHKALLMGDIDCGDKILAATDPKMVKALGQRVKPWDEQLWLDNRCRIMYEACYAKFSAHADLLGLLLRTGNTVLVEASPMDRIWGIGLSATHADAFNVAKWKGSNLLGRVLMRVREALRE
jgi:ribA/ribD-fused uncharacterized protein